VVRATLTTNGAKTPVYAELATDKTGVPATPVVGATLTTLHPTGAAF